MNELDSFTNPKKDMGYKEKTLHLNLKRKWFDMTESGTKLEDYRELTNYWFWRLYGKRVLLNYKSANKAHTYSVLSQNLDLVMKYHGRS